MTYKVAMIGCGGRGRDHVPALIADKRCDVIAVADLRQEAGEAINKDFGLTATVYTDHLEMLQTEKPDIVVLTLWTTLHLRVFKDCVNAGVRAVLSEKPMAPTWGEYEEIARIADESGCQLTFCHQRRFAKGNLLVRKLINEGVFGKVERMDLYSVKNLLDCGTHTFDQALSFNHESPAKWVLGAVDTTEVLNWFGVSAEGMFCGHIVFENGVRANIQAGGPDMDLWAGVRVIGSEGFIEVDWDGKIKRAIVYADPSWTVPTLVEPEGFNPMTDVVQNAIDCLESGEVPELSWKKALRAGEIIFSLYESVRRNRAVTLPLTGIADNPFESMLAAGCFAANKETSLR
jgi:predicted dehydrogenase